MEAKRALRLTGPEFPPEDLSRSMEGGGGPGGGGAGAPLQGAPPEAEATGPCKTKKTIKLYILNHVGQTEQMRMRLTVLLQLSPVVWCCLMYACSSVQMDT